MAFVSRPGVADAPFVVTTEELLDRIRRDYSGHPRLASIVQIANNMDIDQRRFVQPLEVVAGGEGFERRNDRAFRHVAEMGQRAARQAMERADVDPRDIGTLITFHSTGLAIPGLDAHLVNTLPLRSTVLRIPITQLACAGGAQALGLAARLARPEQPVLVVGAEALSSIYQAGDDDLPSIIFKLLFGDGGAAAVVSSEPLGQPGVFIHDSWTYLHPDSAHYYRLRADAGGYHFESTRESVRAVTHIAPKLPWGVQPDFGIVHPGGAGVLNLIAKSGVCPEHALHHSRESMRVGGNCGGPAVLRVLDRTHDEPPARGATGLLFGLGPGFCAAASLLEWVGEPAIPAA